MRIACVSDLHGHLPANVPDCDVLLIGGDICPSAAPMVQRRWLDGKFRRWLERLGERDIAVVGIAGNHDIVMEMDPAFPHGLPWRYLRDSGVGTKGLIVWGTPWSPTFGSRAFMKDEPNLKDWWLTTLPLEADVLLVHGPPFLHGDLSPYGNEHVGSPSLLRFIEGMKPRLVVCGHIHSGHGRHQIGDTLVINASLVDEQYRPAYPIEVVDI